MNQIFDSQPNSMNLSRWRCMGNHAKSTPYRLDNEIEKD